jgi:photosystem II stability/assembly factor-like uncharacterized protein
VNRTTRLAPWPLLGILVAIVVTFPTGPARSADPPAIPPAIEFASADQEKVQQIADIERQIGQLQKKLEDLKKSPASPPKPPAQPEGVIPDSFVKKMNWRSIGPASMGGRIIALAVNPSDTANYYVATATGGLLKTVNNGTTFTHTFEHEATVSIGDVAVAPSNPEIVWVGTGENNPRNSVSYGDGVYKSTDAGKTWTNMGLKQSYQIGKIVIHPKDPNIVYVGALGRLYGPSEERGLYKTTDGGKTWTRVLYVDNKTGVIDFRMDPFDPETLLVGLWERKRDEFDGLFGPSDTWPTTDQYGPEVSYGPGGGLFKTTDGGKSWKKLTDEKLKTGLPTVKTGRIGLDYSAKTKGLVFAIVDTERVGMGAPVLAVYLGLSTEDEKGVGLKVTLVPDDGPAGKAGFKEGDVVAAVDGQKTETYDAFRSILATKKPGDVLKITIKRGGKEQVIEVKLAPREEPAPKTPAGPPPTIGAQLVPAEEGVGIGNVQDEGPAAQAGLQTGDVITGLNGKKVTDATEFRTALSAMKAGDKVKLTVVRDAQDRQVEVILVAGRAGPGGGGAGRGQRANTTRPFLLSGQTGGQRANVQDQQGKEGFQTGGIFVSKDSGETWTRVNSLNARPFYFSQIRVDPSDDNLLYSTGDTSLWKSTNGGKRFEAAPSRGVHPDHHALWIDPKDGRHMLIGCDGGFYVTYDRGTSWDHLNILALGQFYHVAVDNRKPYKVYGGLQDNGSWGGPSHVLRGSGPVNDDWVYVNGGDGFVCRVDPNDPDLIYSESQNGMMSRRNYRTGERGGIRPRPVSQGEELRFNWNTPFILSAHNPSIFYCGAQYVFRSVNKGDNLKAVSPVLTRTNKGSLTAIAESPRTPDVLWAGSDDGYVWVSKDGGQKWENVFEKLKAAGLPGPRWVATIEPSKSKEGRCYVALDGHRSDDDKPYLFVTEDYGQTWQPIAANLPTFGSARMLREDITNPDLLYAGTEFGIWASVNRGKGWAKLNNNLPTVAVHEVAQPTTASEIVIATHGRSLWVLDVASLRQMSPRGESASAVDPLKDPATLFTPAPAVRWKLQAGGESPYSINIRKFYGTNPDRKAGIDYALTKPAKELSLRIVDVTGKPVREFRNASKEVGFHHQTWDLTRSNPEGGGGGGGGRGGGGGGGFGGFGGVLIPAGTYRVVLSVDGKEYTQPITVENDPNADPKALITVADQRVENEEEDDDD